MTFFPCLANSGRRELFQDSVQDHAARGLQIENPLRANEIDLFATLENCGRLVSQPWRCQPMPVAIPKTNVSSKLVAIVYHPLNLRTSRQSFS